MKVLLTCDLIFRHFGLSRDLRKLLHKCVWPWAFEWETQKLIAERVYNDFKWQKAHAKKTRQVRVSVHKIVEYSPEPPDEELHLFRVLNSSHVYLDHPYLWQYFYRLPRK